VFSIHVFSIILNWIARKTRKSGTAITIKALRKNLAKRSISKNTPLRVSQKFSNVREILFLKASKIVILWVVM
jgi:hypothetical protein